MTDLILDNIDKPLFGTMAGDFEITIGGVVYIVENLTYNKGTDVTTETDGKKPTKEVLRPTVGEGSGELQLKAGTDALPALGATFVEPKTGDTVKITQFGFATTKEGMVRVPFSIREQLASVGS